MIFQYSNNKYKKSQIALFFQLHLTPNPSELIDYPNHTIKKIKSTKKPFRLFIFPATVQGVCRPPPRGPSGPLRHIPTPLTGCADVRRKSAAPRCPLESPTGPGSRPRARQ